MEYMDEKRIETIGMRLANRVYLYRVFHIMFGAEPSFEEIKILSDKATLDAFRYLDDIDSMIDVHDETLMQKNSKEHSVSAAFMQTEKLLVSLGEKKADESFIEELHSDFTRLFQVPGSSYVYIWESPYIGKQKTLFQENTLDVRYRYREYGFEAMEAGHFPEDHLSMMLDFLAHLSTRAFDAFGDGNDDECARIVSSQKEFISTHLTNWFHLFLEDLSKKDKAGIYRQFAEALSTFLSVDEYFMEELLAR